MKKVLRYVLALILAVAVGMGLLLLSTFLPQDAIDRNVYASAEKMHAEGIYPMYADYTLTAQLDNHTDAIILAQSKAMSSPETILTNPMYQLAEDDPETENPVEDLYAYVQAEDPEPTSFYVRYWMGFRAVMRLMLSFADHYQLRRYLAALVLGLALAAVCSVAKHVNEKAAFLFGISFVFVRPYMVALTPQFSCCFVIAFIAMLLMPRLSRRPELQGMTFYLLGIVTMFFDFYTTPLITFGLPFVYLYLLSGEGETRKLKTLAKYFLLWGAGYLVMWFAKMVLTTLFTDVNGLENGLVSMLYRLGIRREEKYTYQYSVFQSLRAIWFSLYADETGKRILAVFLGCGVLGLGALLLRRRPKFSQLLVHRNLIAVAALPIIWMLAAPQPFNIHHWFQYRSIAVSFFSFGIYCLLTLAKPKEITE